MIHADVKHRLNEFRRKFYLNQIIRGFLVTSTLFFALYILFVSLEGIAWFSPPIKTLFFIIWLILPSIFAYKSLLKPLLAYFSIGSTISDEDAAKIIGSYFPEIQDKLLNYIQLANSDAQTELIDLAIEQKKFNVIPYNFLQVINLNLNWKYFRYLLIPLFLILFLFVLSPELITKGTYRFINFTKPFSPPPPFQIYFSNLPNKLTDGQDYVLNLKVDGSKLPNELYLYYKEIGQYDFQPILLRKLSNNTYAHKFSAVHNDFEFAVGNELYKTDVKPVSVIKRPSLKSFELTITYPSYTGLQPEKLPQNIGDVSVLKGAVLSWSIVTSENTKSSFFVSDKTQPFSNNKFSKQVFNPFSYTLTLVSNENLPNIDSVRYNVQVIQDKHPEIELNLQSTEIALPNSGIVPIEYLISDDFGFSKMTFNYKIIKSPNANRIMPEFKSILLNEPLNGKTLNSLTKIDAFALGIEQGDLIEFNLTVWDNDNISGYKSSTSKTFKLNYQSISELYDKNHDISKEIEHNIDNSLNNFHKNESLYKDISKKLLENKNVDYELKKQIEKMIENSKNSLTNFEDVKNNFENLKQNSNENDLYNPSTLEKMNQVEQLIKDIENSNLQNQLNELLNTLQKDNKNALKNQLENFKLNQDNLKFDLERLEALIKNLKYEQKVQELYNKLEEIKNQQKSLNQLLDENNKIDSQKLLDKQQEINKNFEKISKDLDELERMSKELKRDNESDFNEINQQKQNTQNQLDNAAKSITTNKKDAFKSQNNATQSMQKMQDKLSQMLQEDIDQQDAENYEDLRALLKNLLLLSFKQEELKDKSKKLKYNDPMTKSLLLDQHKIKDNMEMIKDSLFDLSKRVFQIKKYVTDEVNSISFHIDKTIQNLSLLQLPTANQSQHFVMTGMNNLANMLTESLEQMQQQMKNNKNQSGGGACKKPGGNNNSMQGLAKKQSQLNQILQEMMENGGQNPSKLEQMAKEQESIRLGLKEMFDKISKEVGEKGGLGNLSKVMQDMQETEKELLNKKLSAELLMRQQQILSRMLDYDKSIREREFDNKRKSTTAKQYTNNMPNYSDDTFIQKSIKKESLLFNDYNFKIHYKEIINKYLLNLK